MREGPLRAPLSVGLAHSAECGRHLIPGHPERPERLAAILATLENQGLLELVSPLRVSKASDEDLLSVHSPAFVDRIKSTCAAGGGWLTSDTAVCPGSQEAALWAVGCAFSVVEAVLRQEVKYAFALCRPPGHHANREEARGFCLYNNVGLAATFALEKHGLERIVILDWDLHHGNGTQEIFYDEGRVSFLSVHVYEFPFYPGTGRLEEAGVGAGLGHNVNLPLPSACGDLDYECAFSELVTPVLRAWKPQLLLISAGFDAHERDPFRGMRLTAAGFYRVAEMAKAYADEAKIGLALILEGGYELEALGESVAQVIRVLLGLGSNGQPHSAGQASPEAVSIVQRALQVFRSHWGEAH